jgi:phosphohistidine phosphatase
MELYAIRHAIAEQLGRDNDFTDEKRALTPGGREKMIQAAQGLRRLGVEFDLILTSPFVRARQTAQILADVFTVDVGLVEETENLAPGANLSHLLAEIKNRRRAESVALIGHQPDLGKLISRIVTGREGLLSIKLKKGGVCFIEVTETVPELRGSLVWLLAPKHLRMLGG